MNFFLIVLVFIFTLGFFAGRLSAPSAPRNHSATLEDLPACESPKMPTKASSTSQTEVSPPGASPTLSEQELLQKINQLGEPCKNPEGSSRTVEPYDDDAEEERMFEDSRDFEDTPTEEGPNETSN